MSQMKFFNCPHCKAQDVLPMSDLKCPNCKKQLVNENYSTFVLIKESDGPSAALPVTSKTPPLVSSIREESIHHPTFQNYHRPGNDDYDPKKGKFEIIMGSILILLGGVCIVYGILHTAVGPNSVPIDPSRVSRNISIYLGFTLCLEIIGTKLLNSGRKKRDEEKSKKK